MEITDNRIDAGKAFDWGRTSEEHAKYRDIYPKEFYQKIIDRGVVSKDKRCLTLERVQGCFPVICTDTVQSGQVLIYHLNRLNRQSGFLQQKTWI